MSKNTPIKVSTKQPLLLFDGVCNLCNGYVQWLIKRDPKAHFRYASLQSETGQSVLRQLKMSTKELNTVILIIKGKAYTHSDVPLEIVRKMGGLWSILYVFKLIPPFIRHAIYNWISKNRYQWFGKEENCMLPTPELKARFLN